MSGEPVLRWHFGRAVYSDPVTGQPIVHILADDRPGAARPPAAGTALPPAAQALLDADPHLSREQAAAFLGISATTLAEWASKKKGPPYLTVGVSVQYPLSSLVEWRSQQMKNQQQPAAEPAKRGRGRPRTSPL
jgi:hypothetical protein